jgi:hypothetical protein
MIDKDNLKSNESVGTFRWNDSIKLIDIPRKIFKRLEYLAFKDEYRLLLKSLKEGWGTYLGERFQETANE